MFPFKIQGFFGSEEDQMNFSHLTNTNPPTNQQN